MTWRAYIWWLAFGVYTLLAFLLVSCNLRLYTPLPGPGEMVPLLNQQRQALDAGSAAEMQQLFPEGYFFSYVLYGLTWVEVGLQSAADHPLRHEALREARWAFRQLDRPAARAPFPADLEPPYGMFYSGWRAQLLAGILLLQPDNGRSAEEIAAFERLTGSIASAIENSQSPFLPSYTNQVWPVDTLPAIHALQTHAKLVDARYVPLIERWLAEAQARLDPQTGLLPHRSHPATGAPLEIGRATSQTLILRWLVDIDPVWAQQQYALFRSQFLVTRLGLPGWKEFPVGVNRAGDIDSGPLLGGVSLSATAVGLGTARMLGDSRTGQQIFQGGEALGFPISHNERKRYALGLLPIGDQFLAWSQISQPWFESLPKNSYPAPLGPGWRWPFHFGTAVLLYLLALPLWPRYLTCPFKYSFRKKPVYE